MDKNKEALKYCPHFYSIINFEYYSDDMVSGRLIKIYKKYIFNTNINNTESIEKMHKLDEVLYEYINDYAFRNKVKNEINTFNIYKSDNILESLVNTIIKFFDNYKKIKYREVQVTRWIWWTKIF